MYAWQFRMHARIGTLQGCPWRLHGLKCGPARLALWSGDGMPQKARFDTIKGGEGKVHSGNSGC